MRLAIRHLRQRAGRFARRFASLGVVAVLAASATAGVLDLPFQLGANGGRVARSAGSLPPFLARPAPPPPLLLDDLAAALQQAPNEAQDVILTFNRPLEQIDPSLLPWSQQPDCLRRQFGASWAVACRLLTSQINDLTHAGIVAQVERDQLVHATRTSSNIASGTTAARAEFGLTGDGDGDPETYSARDNTIAVIDTGIDVAHPDFASGKVIDWKDFVNERPEPYDDEGHGTHVASIAAGHRAGGTDGVAPGAALVGLKVLDSSGEGRSSDIAAAIQYCIDERDRLGIRVINLSLSSDTPSSGRDFQSRIVNQARDSGLVVVVAAGNEGPTSRTIGSPAAAAGAITVGSMADPARGGFTLSPFSSRGPTTDGRIKPDICAPGESILAARANSASYLRASGTSMSAPFVAGVAALMAAANPAITPVEVRDILERTAIDFGTPGKDSDYGAGRLDAYQAIRAARSENDGGGTPPAAPIHTSALDTIADQATTGYPVEISSTQFPIAVTLILPDWTRANGPTVTLQLLNPSGQVVSAATMTQREMRLRFSPHQTGTYTLQVISTAGSGSFILDVSGGSLVSEPAGEGGE